MLNVTQEYYEKISKQHWIYSFRTEFEYAIQECDQVKVFETRSLNVLLLLENNRVHSWITFGRQWVACGCTDQKKWSFEFETFVRLFITLQKTLFKTSIAFLMENEFCCWVASFEYLDTYQIFFLEWYSSNQPIFHSNATKGFFTQLNSNTNSDYPTIIPIGMHELRTIILKTL